MTSLLTTQRVRFAGEIVGWVLGYYVGVFLLSFFWYLFTDHVAPDFITGFLAGAFSARIMWIMIPRYNGWPIE